MKHTCPYVVFFLLVFWFHTVPGTAQPSSSLSRISVRDNHFVDESGKTVVFHGINISDPDKLADQGHWDQSLFEEAISWGADIIRIPIHPEAWRDRGSDQYLALLDQSVEWANELGVYLIFDWHSIGNLQEELFQSSNYITSFEETIKFWKVIAERYSDEPAVAMYELYNEPTVTGKRFGDLTWKEWKAINESIIDEIRKVHPGAVVLVSGFNWAYDLTPVKNDPVDRSGVGYVSHPYPQKREQPWIEKWEKDWGFVAETYPVILTEIGFALPDEKGVHIPVKGDEVYGQTIVSYTKEKGISWVVWCFDPDWPPLMYTDWNYTPTHQGIFFRHAMTAD